MAIEMLRRVALAGIVLGAGSVSTATAQTNGMSNPYRMVDGWAKMPEGRQMGRLAA